MSNKTILEPWLPATQSVEAVKSLVEFVTIKPCAKLPAIFNLVNGMQLILSSKKDVYYTTLQSCTCKTGENHKICCHRRNLCEATGDATKTSISARVEEAKVKAKEAKSQARRRRPRCTQ